MKKQAEYRYDDIINLPHHTSKKRTPMPIQERAAQFAPFSALTGHGAAVKETARLTELRVELDEYEKAALDRKLRLIVEKIQEHPMVHITYFQADTKKEGGTYVAVTGQIKKVDGYERSIVMQDGKRIPIDEIIEIED